MKHITSRQNPLVSRYRAVADGTERTQILIDGVHLVADAFDAGIPISQVMVTLEALDRADVAALASRLVTQTDVCSVSPAVMAALSPVRSSSPIVALAPRPSCDAQALYRLAPALVVCAVDVQDPGNVGAIVRVSEAGGASGVAVAGPSADPYGWKALRGAMGSAFRLPLLHPCDPDAMVADARRHGCQVIATVPRGGTWPEAIDLTRPVLVLLGGEGPGLPDRLIASADARLSFPMAPPVESLNTAIGAALVVYEARRQRAWASPTLQAHPRQADLAR